MASEYSHQEVQCQRNLSNGAFSAGIADWVFSIGRPRCFIPSKSYFRVELSLKAGTAAQPTIADQLALAEGCVSNAFNNCYFIAGSDNLSAITNYMPQVSAVECRTSNTSAWLNSVGDSAFATGANFSERVARLATGSATSGFSQKPGAEITYRPATAGNYKTATLAAAPGVAVVGVTTNFELTDVGSTLVLNGAKYTIVGRTTPLDITVEPAITTAVTVTTNWYLVRRQTAITDGSLQGKNALNIIWRPSAMGIFNYGGVLGAGDYRIQLNPSTDYKTAMVETPNPDYTVSPAASYTLEIQNVTFYAATAAMSVPDGITSMRLTEFAALTKNISTPSENFQFTVPASTRAIYIMLQAGDAGKNPKHPPNKFAVDGQELDLRSIQVTYGGVTLPRTRWVSEFKVDAPNSKALMSQMYYQSLLDSDRASMSGGAESQNDWLARGPMMCFNFSKDVDNRSTEVQVSIEYGGVAWDNTSKLLLVAEYTNQIDIHTQQGLITQVVKVVSA
jgi:hypothetical protein